MENFKSGFVSIIGRTNVGKSTLLNSLVGEKVAIMTNKTQTTRTAIRAIVNRKNSQIIFIDTPGIRRFVLDDIEADDLALYFREFEPFIGKCKFGLGCKHDSEPECAVRKAVEEGKITEERYDSWKRISNEIRTGSWED